MQSWLQAADHQRRLAAARSPHHRQQPLGRQGVDHLVGLLFTAKEEMFLLLLKGAKTGVWVTARSLGSRTHG
jgi:hypothetical protein